METRGVGFVCTNRDTAVPTEVSGLRVWTPFIDDGEKWASPECHRLFQTRVCKAAEELCLQGCPVTGADASAADS